MKKALVALAIGLSGLVMGGCFTPASIRKDYYKDHPAIVANRVSLGIFCYCTQSGVLNAMQRMFMGRGVVVTWNRGAGVAWTGPINQPTLGDFTLSATLKKAMIDDEEDCIRVDWKLVGKAGPLDEQASKAYVDGLNQDLFKCLKELDEEK